jgi:uncharacterized repeat protein (TIGR03803 family)
MKKVLRYRVVAYAVFLLCMATAIGLSAQTVKTLVRFNQTDGASPYSASLVQGFDGSLYGTTTSGGGNNDGTVFKVTPEGTLTTLHSFGDGTDGLYPYAGLVQATNGKLYGTTTEGGELCKESS